MAGRRPSNQRCNELSAKSHVAQLDIEQESGFGIRPRVETGNELIKTKRRSISAYKAETKTETIGWMDDGDFYTGQVHFHLSQADSSRSPWYYYTIFGRARAG